MNFDKRMFEAYPELFYKNDKGEAYVPCGLYCPEGWQPVVEELFGLMDSYVTKSSTIVKNPKTKLFYKVYRTIWTPILRRLKKYFDPYKGIEGVKFGNAISYLRQHQEAAKLTKNYAITQKLNAFDWSLRKDRPEYIGLPIEPVYIDQVKEKFGELRIYISGGDKKIEGMISFAERLSNKTCEMTGDKGVLCKRGGCYKTLSPDKAKELEYKEIHDLD